MLALLTNYLVCELPGVLARRPGAVSVGLIDQDLHPAARVRPLGIKHSHMSERSDNGITVTPWTPGLTSWRSCRAGRSCTPPQSGGGESDILLSTLWRRNSQIFKSCNLDSNFLINSSFIHYTQFSELSEE